MRVKRKAKSSTQVGNRVEEGLEEREGQRGNQQGRG